MTSKWKNNHERSMIIFSLVYRLEPTFFFFPSFHLEPDQTGWNKGPHPILPGVASSSTGSMLGLHSAGPHASFFYTLALQYLSSGFRVQRRHACEQIEVKSTL